MNGKNNFSKGIIYLRGGSPTRHAEHTEKANFLVCHFLANRMFH